MGYDAEHDAGHGDGGLLHAAMMVLVDLAGHELRHVDPPSPTSGSWVDDLVLKLGRRLRADEIDEVRVLTVAGALVAAEIDRLLRIERAYERNRSTDSR